MYVRQNTTTGDQALSHHNTAFHQLVIPLPRHDFEGMPQKQHVGQKLRLASQQHNLYYPGAKPITRYILARINENQPAELY